MLIANRKRTPNGKSWVPTDTPWQGPPTTMSLPHALDRFLERCHAIVTTPDRSVMERELRDLMPDMTYSDGTWDKHALDGLGQGFWTVDYQDEHGAVFTIVGTVDGVGTLRTINSCILRIPPLGNPPP